MQNFKIANVLLECNPRSVNYPSLYCRASAPVVQDPRSGLWELRGPGSFDFMTYFNAVSVAKWRKYTHVKSLFLHIELKGAACKVVLTGADAMAREAAPYDVEPLEVPASGEWASFDLEVPVRDQDVLSSFLIESEGVVNIKDSFYYTQVDACRVRPVELSLATTTFKKEDFIVGNIEMVKKEILGCDEPIAKHFRMHVVDNGSTLDAEALSDDRVTVHPNSNVGGSGGFAYGMIASLEQDVPATNVLLMDDDVAVSPESIKRTFNLLSLLKDEYKDSFISGAMLNYDIGEDQWEDIGFMSKEGRFNPVKPSIRVTLLQDLIYNETFEEPEEWVDQTYAAWWYCCIPADTIRREGLPLPVFVRCDDAEYGIRCKPNFITMNSICIWHLSFHARYNAAVERYQTTRNTLIAQATTGMAPESDFLMELRNNMQIELKKFNYASAELLLDGFEDFLKGPSFISERVAEECFMRSNRKAEKLVPFDELQKQLDEIEGVKIDLSKLTVGEVDRDRPRTRGQALMDFITFNGQRTPLATGSEGVSIIPAAGWIYPAGKIRKKEVLVAIDQFNRKGAIRRRDKKRFDEIMERYKKDLKFYRQNKERLESEYSAARERLTSFEYWKWYLQLD